MGNSRAEHDQPSFFSVHRRFMHAWNHSLQFKLLWLGLMPVLFAFPIVLLLLSISGGTQLNQLIKGQLNSNLSGAQNYLHVMQSDLQTRIVELVQSERITNLIQENAPRKEIDQTLSTMLRGSGFDFLLVIGGDGVVMGSSNAEASHQRIPESYVIRQAQIGVASSGFEQYTLEQLSVMLPARTKQLFAQTDKPTDKRTLINAAAHFPLSATTQDAVLAGGLFIDHNNVLIEHMREIIYPAGKLPDNSEGFVGIFVGNKSILNSRLLSLGTSPVEISSHLIPSENIGPNPNQYGTQKIGDTHFALAVSPILNGDEHVIAALAVGFPKAPYTNTAWLLLAIVSGMLGFVMLIISLVNLRAGQSIVTSIKKLSNTLNLFGEGNRLARLDKIQGQDELGMLARHVNTLLETIYKQEQEQVATQRAISDEASRRRAIFKSVRDGVVIQSSDGKILEVNPQFCKMTGYSEQELNQLKIYDWDSTFCAADYVEKTEQLSRIDSVFESVHTRKDGRQYFAETSFSHAKWSDKKFILMLIRDITARKTQEENLKISASVFTAALEAIVLTDPAGNITDVNEAFTKIVGYEKEEVIGKNSSEIGFHDNDNRTFNHILTALENRGFWTGEVLLPRKNGELFPAQLKTSAVKFDDGTVHHFVAMFSDISVQKQQQLRLEQMALHDNLTKLANRQRLDDRLTLAMANSARSGRFGALLMLDLDNFKPLNDRYGHASGDQLLIEAAKRLTLCVREIDTVARTGGDEFVVLLESLSDDQLIAQQDATNIAEKIRKAIAQPYLITSKDQSDLVTTITHSCTASIGVTLFSGKELSKNELLNRADAAMYASKAKGKNSIHLNNLLAVSAINLP